MSDRDSFIFYRSFYEALVELQPTEAYALFTAICEYALNHKQTELDGVAKGMWKLILPQLEANYKKWQNGCKDKTSTKQGESKSEAKAKQNKSKTEGNENVNENVNENDNDNGNGNGNVLEEAHRQFLERLRSDAS